MSCTSGFVDDVMLAHTRSGNGDASTVTHPRQHGFDTEAYTRAGSPGGSTGRGAESDVYDWLVQQADNYRASA